MIEYEWKVEHLDEYDDIIDLSHHPATKTGLMDALGEAVLGAKGAVGVDICLVRNEIIPDQGVIDRRHAYISQRGKILRWVEYGGRPPARFIKIVEEVAIQLEALK